MQRKWLRGFERIFSDNNIAVALLLVSIAIAAGIVFVLAERPPFSLGTYFVYPGTSSQTTSEFLILFFIYALSVAGLILIYESPKYRSRPSLASTFLVSGVAVVVISVILLFLVYGMK
ncbi:MAG: hypothetical protein ABWK01_05385 [Infirmifilum sp.]